MASSEPSLWAIKNLKNILPKETFNLFILIFTIDFLISTSFCMVRNIRLAMVVTGSDAGSELIPYIQFWLGLPAAFIMVAILARLARVFSAEKIFYFVVIAFTGFFICFALCIFPARYDFHQAFQSPPGTNAFWLMFELWDLSAFYVIAGLWKIMILPVLFWGYVNRRILMKEAKKIYSPLMLAGAVAGIVAGNISDLCAKESFLQLFNFQGLSSWHSALVIQIGILTLLAGLIMICFSQIAKLLRRRHVDVADTVAQVKDKKNEYQKQLSLASSLSYFFKRPTLCALGIIVIASYIAISLCEIVYLNKLGEVYPNPIDFCAFQGRFSYWTGSAIAIFALFISTPLVLRGKWLTLALITPALLLVTSIIFFFFTIFGYMPWMNEFTRSVFNCSPIFIAAMAGAFMRTVYSASKNTILSSVKELTFVTLSGEDQLKGKFVVDGIGSRFGNSSASLISQSLIFMFGSLDGCLPLVAFIAIAFMALWTRSALQIGRHMIVYAGDDKSSTKNLQKVAV